MKRYPLDEIMFDLGTIIVAVSLSVVITLLAVAGYIKIRFGAAEKAIKTGMSALGTASADSRQLRAMEKSVAQDLLNGKFPELTMILEQLSPETLDMITENPEVALKMIERFEPLINKFMGGITKNPQQKGDEYDIGSDPSKFR